MFRPVLEGTFLAHYHNILNLVLGSMDNQYDDYDWLGTTEIDKNMKKRSARMCVVILVTVLSLWL